MDVARRGAAAAHRPGDSSPCCRTTATATSSARSRTPRTHASTTTGSSCSPPARRSRPSSRASRTRSRGTRRRRGSRSSELERALDAASPGVRGRVRAGSASAGSRSCSARSATDLPTSNHTSYLRRLSPLEQTYTKERAVEVCVATLRPARLRSRVDAGHPPRPRRPPAEVAARLRDRVRPAERRPPDHAGPGRAARLPGVPPRGRATRSTTRAVDPRPAVHLPQALARPRADGDLLVHRRGDLARARLARRALRALRRAGGRERRGDGLPRGAALPPLRREAPVRARLLGPLRRRRRHAGRLLGAADRGDRDPLPGRELPLRHGRRLLLGRLPPRVDPLGAAARSI